jgi:hypothetical protein
VPVALAFVKVYVVAACAVLATKMTDGKARLKVMRTLDNFLMKLV